MIDRHHTLVFNHNLVEVENGTKSIHLLSTNFSYWVWHAWLIVISEALQALFVSTL